MDKDSFNLKSIENSLYQSINYGFIRYNPFEDLNINILEILNNSNPNIFINQNKFIEYKNKLYKNNIDYKMNNKFMNFRKKSNSIYKKKEILSFFPGMNEDDIYTMLFENLPMIKEITTNINLMNELEEIYETLKSLKIIKNHDNGNQIYNQEYIKILKYKYM